MHQLFLFTLHQLWVENVLHDNIFKSPLDRDHFPWNQRKEDFELFAPSDPAFGDKDPLSIHLPGVKQKEDKMAVKMK